MVDNPGDIGGLVQMCGILGSLGIGAYVMSYALPKAGEVTMNAFGPYIEMGLEAIDPYVGDWARNRIYGHRE